MNERVLDQLDNVPTDVEDAFIKLKELCNSQAKAKDIGEEEKKRLNYELDLIKKWGIAKIFLFGYNLCVNDGLGTTYGVEANSYVNYLLGITKVNPVKYNLPFERFFNEYRKSLPEYYIVLPKGNLGKALKTLYSKYGKSLIVKSVEDNDNYFVLGKPINPELIKENRINAKLNQESFEENISVLSYMEMIKLGYYNFSIVEVEGIEYSTKEKFLEEEIYEKAELDYRYNLPDTPEFTDIEEVKEILVNTKYKLIYQEQLMEILNKLCGYDLAKADFIRREISKAKKDSLGEVQEILLEKYGDNGQKLFDYLYKTGRYTLSKAWAIASLCNSIEY